MMAMTKPSTDDISVSSEFSNWPALLRQLLYRQSLTVSQATALMQGWLTNAIPDVLSGAILVAIQSKGVSAQELIGIASVLQSQTSPLSTLIDTCGTGGDAASTFNISTSVAFVAAAGVKVAKQIVRHLARLVPLMSWKLWV